MDNKLIESYFDFIAEQIVDENKIVTYKSLSRSLGIHVNTAKQLLYAYLKKEKCTSSFPISATYLVAGKVLDGSFNITLVNEDNLNSSSANFIETTSEHVYSVQKGKGLREMRVLGGIGRELANIESSKLVIKCYKNIPQVKVGVKKKHESYEDQSRKVIREALMPERQEVIAVESKIKINSTDQKVVVENLKKPSSKGNSVKGSTNVKKPFGNIASLFAKASNKNSDKSVISEKDEINFKEIPKEIDIVDLNKAEEIDGSKSECCTEGGGGEVKDNLKRKSNRNKRKRIQMLSDSEENDSNDGMENDEFLQSANFEEKIKEIEEEKYEKNDSIPQNKKKKRKVIDRTVTSEDGYLETIKKVIFETDSENESEDIKTLSKEPVKQNTDKSKSFQGGETAKKQSSILTFFKKT